MKGRIFSTLVACTAWLTAAGNVLAVDVEDKVSALRGALTTNGAFYVTWTSDPDPIPLNEMFEIRFRVVRANDRQALVPGAVVTASAWMPVHNHGTTLQPQVESAGDGTATARGFLLHMQGQWELRVGVAVNGQMERATFDIQLDP